jgi:DNA adenine methylase
MVDIFLEQAMSENLIEAGRKKPHKFSQQRNVPVIRPERLPTLLKWAGGKEQELRHILPLLPSFRHYYEPFVGGGAVFFSVQAEKKFINDKSSELIDLYKMVAENNCEFFQILCSLVCQWQHLSQFMDAHAMDLSAIYKAYSRGEDTIDRLREKIAEFTHCYTEELKGMFTISLAINLENFIWEIERNFVSKATRMKRLEDDKGKLPESDIVANIESALKSAFYMHLRYLYNRVSEHQISTGIASAIFFFVREHAYASMFRYNRQGDFNVPYGGISYNRKDLMRKVACLQSPEVHSHFANTVIENLDFEAFLQKHPPEANDFIFLDPPYDSEFSTYTQNEFCKRDQERLAYYLLHQCNARFMLVIKNTPMIYALYSSKGLNIQAFNKRYLVSFQDRNKRESEHLIITNFDT